MSRAEVIAMGVDLSLTSTGLAVMSKTYGMAASGTTSRITTDPKRWAKTTAGRNARLNYIVDEIDRMHEAFNPDIAVIEAPSYGSKFGSAHDRSGLWWRVVDCLLEFGPVATVPPQTRAKYATGSGTAGKEAVEAAVRETYKFVISEWPTGKCDDIADAVALCAMGMRHLGSPVESSNYMTEARLAAMAGAEWPAKEAA